jgi:hypothetical protein
MSAPDPDWLESARGDIQKLYRYWKSKAGARRMPGRQDIDPLELVPFLPSIMLVDVVAPGDYVYRLVGTREVELRGNDPTGKPVATHGLAGMIDLALQNYDTVVQTRAPLLDRNDEGLQFHERFQDLDCVFLPLARDGEQVDMVLVYTVQRELTYAELEALSSVEA